MKECSICLKKFDDSGFSLETGEPGLIAGGGFYICWECVDNAKELVDDSRRTHQQRMAKGFCNLGPGYPWMGGKKDVKQVQ